MTEVDIKQLQTERRFSDVGLKNVCLVLYLPVGLIIVVLRLLLGFMIWVLSSVLPDVAVTKSLLNKLSCALFGIVVHVDNASEKKRVKIFISNQITPLDHFIIHVAADTVAPCVSNSQPQLLYSLGLKTFGSSSNIDEFKKSIFVHVCNNTIPVLFQPENKITNGNGVLKFKDWPFSFTDEVQPLCLKVRRPLLDISVTTLGSSYWNDMFWYLFSPWTVYNVYFLPVVERNDSSNAEFAEKVQQKIAEELNVVACSYSASDVGEWEKRYLAEQRRARMVQNTSSNNVFSNNPELHRMTRQVKEVLPTVPYNVIFKEIIRTRNIDLTISNILEGHISYTPEIIVSATPVNSSVSVSAAIPGPSCMMPAKETFNTAASTFPKSAQERMQSFQERKLQLIASARKRYIEKHGLDVKDSDSC